MRMIDAVANSIERDPDILGAAVRLAIAVDDDFGDARIARQHPGIAAKADHRIGRAGPVFDDQARNEPVPAADVQLRPPGVPQIIIATWSAMVSPYVAAPWVAGSINKKKHSSIADDEV